LNTSGGLAERLTEPDERVSEAVWVGIRHNGVGGLEVLAFQQPPVVVLGSSGPMGVTAHPLSGGAWHSAVIREPVKFRPVAAFHHAT
jgi:hypothetical protein